MSIKIKDFENICKEIKYIIFNYYLDITILRKKSINRNIKNIFDIQSTIDILPNSIKQYSPLETYIYYCKINNLKSKNYVNYFNDNNYEIKYEIKDNMVTIVIYFNKRKFKIFYINEKYNKPIFQNKCGFNIYFIKINKKFFINMKNKIVKHYKNIYLINNINIIDHISTNFI